MRFATLGSGSAGNATLVEHDGDAVLIDCGMSVREVSRRAAALDFDLASLRAILVTHEHEDHVGGCGKLARRFGTPLFATAGTCYAAAHLLTGVEQVHTIVPDTALQIGALAIMPVIVPHDAREPCQFVLGGGEQRLGVLTDLGQSTPHLERSYGGLDGLVIEFNHDADLLRQGPYPQALKDRVGGGYGHLSNTQATALLAALDRSRLRQVVAAHLSEKNNRPDIVSQQLSQALPDAVPRSIASQHEPSPWFTLGGA